MTQDDKEIIENHSAIMKTQEDYKEEDMEYNHEGQLVVKRGVGVMVRNPNKANKYTPDPRQELCWKFYIQGLTKGVPNAKAAALKAGYSTNTALVISQIKWFADRKAKLKRSKMLSRAERNLGRILDMDYTSIKLMPDGEQIEEVNTDKLRIVADISYKIATTLGKDEGYSTKTTEEKNVNQAITVKSISYADPIEVEGRVIGDAVLEQLKENHDE